MDYARFEALLHAHNTTVYRVSKVTGIAHSTFSDWKSGRSTPKADKLRRIADFFGISTDSLLGSEVGIREGGARLSLEDELEPVGGVGDGNAGAGLQADIARASGLDEVQELVGRGLVVRSTREECPGDS